VNGISSRTRIVKQVEFDLYIPGRIRGTPVDGHFHVCADVIDNLGPKPLLGMGFMIENGVKIDITRKRGNFRSVFDMTVDIEVMQRKAPILRKVKAAMTVEVRPGAEALIPVTYLDLPKPTKGDHSEVETYHLMASHPWCMDSLVTAQTQKAVILYNSGAKPIRINQGEKIGHIVPYVGDEEFVPASWPRIRESWEGDPDDLDEEHWAMLVHQGPQAEELPTNEAADKPPDKPEYYTPSYGIEKVDDLPAIKASAGVSICNKDPEFAEQVKALLDRYDVFRDRGIVPMAEDQKLRIPLVDGWQNQLRPARSYPLGREDKEFLDIEHNKLHAQGKMDFLDEPTPIACPVFIVWRVVNGKKKGRVVVDLRPVNAVAVPDVYPLPDQDDIIGDLTGKKWLTVFDARGFFHQLPIANEHRNRMVVISPEAWRDPTS